METTNLEKENGVAIITPESKLKSVLEQKGITPQLLEELKANAGLKVNAKIEGDKVIWNNDALEIIKATRKRAKAARVIIEKICKADRDAANLYIKDNRTFELGWTNQFMDLEEGWQKEEDSVEALKEQIRIEEEKAQETAFRARATELEKFGMKSVEFGDAYQSQNNRITSVDLKFMPESGYMAFLTEVKAEYQKEEERLAKIEAEKKEAEAILLKQKEEQQQEALRLEGIRREQEKKEKEIADAAAKLEAEKKAIEDAKRKEEEEKQRAIEMQKAREEAAEKAKKEAEEKAERERIAAEAKAKADEAARIEAEKKAAEKEARRIARMPDKKKLIEFADAITAIVSPELKSEEAAKILNDAVLRLSQISQTIKSQTETL